MDITGFKGIPTGNICDSNNRLGAMDSEIKPLSRHMSMVGRAMTVFCAAGDNLTIHKAVTLAKPGDVLVINCCGYKNAGVFGELLAISCMTHGIAGVVIDGACRDKNDLIELGFPVFTRAVCPNGTVKEFCSEVNQPINCGGIAVNPGDVVIGDCDGVVVIPSSNAEEVLKKSKAKKAAEDEMRKKLESGETTAQLLSLYSKFK